MAHKLFTIPHCRYTPGLESLDLGRNPFPVLRGGDLQRLQRLKRLQVSGCGRLEAVEAGALEGAAGDLEVRNNSFLNWQ